MMDRSLLRRILHRLRPLSAVSGGAKTLPAAFQHRLCSTSTLTAAADGEKSPDKGKTNGRWFTLPPFTPTIDGSALGKELSGRTLDGESKTGNAAAMTALKWIVNCCPQIPISLVHKLFRLRQVRREYFVAETKKNRLKRVGARDLMSVGDRILLPISVKDNIPMVKAEDESACNENEMNFIQGLKVYKDSAIIVINKPPGIPVQGGIGIERSLDDLAAKYLKYDYAESPRLVHRLDRDSSGILVMGRTQLSATILHSIFREKTAGASDDVNSQRTLQKRYWALVFGSPRRPEGAISVPLGKVVIDNGKSERITVVDKAHTQGQHALTEYRVIASSPLGCTWLELSPLTGRKHQLRVHCAEVLGTPIVGDNRYGWQARRKLKRVVDSISNHKWNKKIYEVKPDPFGLDLEGGSICDEVPRLHLHCKEMVLPNISMALQHVSEISQFNPAEVDNIKLEAPLPSHMQRSWDLLN